MRPKSRNFLNKIKQMNKNLRALLDIVFYVVVFFLIQLFFIYLVQIVGLWTSGKSLLYVLDELRQAPQLTGEMLATVDAGFARLDRR